MKKNTMKNYAHCSLMVLLCLAISFVFAGQLHASISTSTATVTGFANATGGNAPNPFQITFTGLPTDSVDGGILTLVTYGDFNSAKEWIDISIDGNDYGRLWDNRGSNDDFEGFTHNNDNGQQYGEFGTNAGATLELSESELDAFLFDGTFVLGFDEFGFKVDNIQAPSDIDEYITATLEFNVANISGDPDVVPEPTTFVVWSLLLGTCRFGSRGWRRADRG